MICTVLRVWDKWAAVVDSKVICISRQKDRAVTIWKRGDARMSKHSIHGFVFLTFLDLKYEYLPAKELLGHGKTYRSAKRSAGRFSDEDKDEIARAIELVRSAKWAQLPPGFRAYDDAGNAWHKARAAYLHAAAMAVKTKTASQAAATLAAKARRRGNIVSAEAAEARATRPADLAKTLMRTAMVARDVEIATTAVLHEKTAAHLASKQWESRELIAYRARVAVADAQAARRRARARGEKPSTEAEAKFAQSVEEAETLMQKLRDEDAASRSFRSLGPVWRPFNI